MLQEQSRGCVTSHATISASGVSECAWWHRWGEGGMLLQWGAGTEQAQAQFCRVCTFRSLCNLWPSVGRHWKRSRRSSIDHRGSLPPAQVMGFLVTTCVFSTEWLQLPEGTSPFLLSQTWFGRAVCCSSTDAPGCVAAREAVSLFQPAVFITAVFQLKEGEIWR